MGPAARVLATGAVALALMGGVAASGRADGPAPRAEAPPPVAERPLRVMSMNLCTDQIVLMLLPPERITSVTWLSRDPAGSVMVGAARRVGVNHGQAEEVLRDDPDLVIAGAFTTPVLRGMLRRLGYRLEEVGHASGFDDIRAITRQIGAAVGEPARAEALVAAMDAELAALEAAPAAWRPRVVAWDGGGSAQGAGTLFHAIVEAAGARNVAAEQGLAGHGGFDVESLIAAAPDALIEGDGRATAPDRRADMARHPFTRRYYADRRIAVPQSLHTCGTPLSARAARQLRAQLDGIAARVGTGPAYGAESAA